MKKAALALSSCALILGAYSGSALADPSSVAPAVDPCANQEGAEKKEGEYGPVLKVRPQGVTEEQGAAQKRRSPAKRAEQSDEGDAAQKAAEEGASEPCPAEIGGGLDRDIVRQIPGKPKPKPSQ